MEPGQNQSQQQTQTVQISVQSAGDLELEQSIFRDVSSVGRQLATILDVLDELLGAAVGNQSAALQKFRDLRAQIASEKARVGRARLDLLGEPDQLVQAIEALRDNAPERYAAYRESLSAWARAAVSPGAIDR